MPWAAAITAVGSIAGASISSGKGSSSSGSSDTTTTTDASRTPIASQGAALDSALAGAQTVYDTRTAAGPYGNSTWAGFNPTETQAVADATQFGAGTGQTAANTTAGIGQQGGNALGTAVNTATGVANNGIGAQNGALTGALAGYATGATPVVQQPLSDALHTAATAGATAIGDYNKNLSGVISSATADPTADLTKSAQTYMNSGATQAMLDNVNGQIDTTLNEVTNPGLNRAAAMGGNLNSSRAGMAEAMANRDAALAKGNADSSILNNAYTTGLSMAASQRTAGLNTATAAASAGLTGNSSLALGTGNQDVAAANTAIGAANSGLSQDTAHQTADASARLAAAGQLNTSANTAVNANTAAINQGASAIGMQMAAGTALQANDQGASTDAYNQWKMQNEYQQGVLNDFMSNATKPTGFYNASTAATTDNSTSATPASSMGSLVAGGATALGSQFAPGGVLNSKNADGTTNRNYAPSAINNYFGGWVDSNTGQVSNDGGFS